MDESKKERSRRIVREVLALRKLRDSGGWDVIIGLLARKRDETAVAVLEDAHLTPEQREQQRQVYLAYKDIIENYLPTEERSLLDALKAQGSEEELSEIGFEG